MTSERVIVEERLWGEAEGWLRDEVGVDLARPSLEELRALASIDPSRSPEEVRGVVALLRGGVQQYLSDIDRWTVRLLSSMLLGPAPLAQAYEKLGLPLVSVEGLPPQPSVNVLYWLVEYVKHEGSMLHVSVRSRQLVLGAREWRADSVPPELVLDLLRGRVDTLYELLASTSYRLEGSPDVARHQNTVTINYENDRADARIVLGASFTIVRPPSLVLRVRAGIERGQHAVDTVGRVDWFEGGLPHVTATLVLSEMERVLSSVAVAWEHYGDHGAPRLSFSPGVGLEAEFGSRLVKLRIAGDMVRLEVRDPALALAVSRLTGVPWMRFDALVLPRDAFAERDNRGMPFWVYGLLADGAVLAGLYDRGLDPANLAERVGREVERCSAELLRGGTACDISSIAGAAQLDGLCVECLGRPLLEGIIAHRRFTYHSLLGAGALLAAGIRRSVRLVTVTLRALGSGGFGWHPYLVAGFLDGLAIFGFPDYDVLTENFMDLYACPPVQAERCEHLKSAIANTASPAALAAYARRSWRISTAASARDCNRG